MQPLSIYLILMMIFQFSGCAKTTSTASVAPITDGGASPSQKTAAPITNVGALPAQKTQSELRVGAEPYYANRQESTFGQDMSQKGILPVMVFLQNNGAQPLKVTPNLISLEFQDGGEVKCEFHTNRPASGSGSAPPPDTTGAKVARVAAVTGLIALFHCTITDRYSALGQIPGRNPEGKTPGGITKNRATGGDSGQGRVGSGLCLFPYPPRGSTDRRRSPNRPLSAGSGQRR